MPITIGNMTSNVNVVDSNNLLSDAVMEQIIRQVMMRLKAEQYAESQRRENREIRNQATTPEPF
ncbi:hypothetical protein [Floridanema aerugineum]|uniref:Uncharacterized protein n=1 Tax=Floridaenema aerugineum BLCC-F46 TaxID=3153654 RepID=A0ABV4XFX3_9CYAN